MTPKAGLFDGHFRQMAWITNDLDAALKLFEAHYGVRNWLVLRDYRMQTKAGPDDYAQAHIALALRGGLELELIQPLGGADQVYRQVLTDDPGLQLRFHHVCYRYDTAETIRAVRAAAEAKGWAIVLEGGDGNGLDYFYTDDRAMLGHHVEHIYYPPEHLEQLKAVIPVN